MYLRIYTPKLWQHESPMYNVHVIIQVISKKNICNLTLQRKQQNSTPLNLI